MAAKYLGNSLTTAFSGGARALTSFATRTAVSMTVGVACFWGSHEVTAYRGYDRNVWEPATLLSMIEYIHNNLVRRGLVAAATDWIWSSARFHAGWQQVPIRMDALPCLDG